MRFPPAVPVVLVLLIAGCASPTRVLLEAAPAPAPLARHYAGFWEAALAFDFDGAARLAPPGAQFDYLLAVRLIARGELESGQQMLSSLIAAHDIDASARARALLAAVIKESRSIPANAFSSRVDRSFAEALHEARAREQRHFPAPGVTLPFERSASSTPVVPVTANGVRTSLGIDTGAGLTVIGSDLANAAGAWRTGARTGARDAHGEGVHVAELAVVNLDFGGIRLERHPVMVIDSARLRFRAAGRDITQFEGVLGWNALAAMRVVIDNPARTVRFERPEPGGARHQDLLWVGEPYVRVRSPSGFPLTLFLDTGASRSAIARPLAAAAGLRDAVARDTLLMATGSSRRVTVMMYRDAALHVGGARLRFDELPEIEPRDTGYAVRDGVLGADALLEGRVTIDFSRREFSIATR